MEGTVGRPVFFMSTNSRADLFSFSLHPTISPLRLIVNYDFTLDLIGAQIYHIIFPVARRPIPGNLPSRGSCFNGVRRLLLLAKSRREASRWERVDLV